MEQSNDCVDISLDLTSPSSQVIDVTIKWMPRSLIQNISLPKWTPGSYTIRDHVQHLYDLNILQDGKILKSNRKDTNYWQINLFCLSEIELTYKVVARDFTVRTSYMDNNLASLTLTSLVMLIEEQRSNKHLLTIKINESWNYFIPLEGYINHDANNYDELVDSPLIAGKIDCYSLKVNKYKHEVIFTGDISPKQKCRIINDMQKVCQSAIDIMDTDLPSSNRYKFFIHFIEGKYGGLEHENSSVIQFCWKKLESEDGYRKLMQLIGHEYFHQWNVKRLRPKEYINYNYNKEVLSENLWFAEGVTSYLDYFLPFMAGITSEKNLYRDLESLITRYYNSPGRKYQSLSQSSIESWIKLYKSNPTSIDNQISYYNLGSIIALCLDIRLREKNKSLSYLLRQLWSDTLILKNGYSRNIILKILSNIDINISNDLSSWLDIPGHVDIENCLSKVGIKIATLKDKKYISGLHFVKEVDNLKVSRVETNSSAMKAGIVPGDIILAINSYIVKNERDLELLIKEDSSYKITYNRNGYLMSTELSNTNNYSLKYNITLDSMATNKQKQLRRLWLNIV